MMPNINLVLIIGGSIFGTITSIIIPIVFYNKAYSSNYKNLSQDISNSYILNNSLDGEIPKLIDKRKTIKIINYIILLAGIIVGAFGLYDAI